MWAAHLRSPQFRGFKSSVGARFAITMRPFNQLGFGVDFLGPQRGLPQDPQAAAGSGSHRRVPCGHAQSSPSTPRRDSWRELGVAECPQDLGDALRKVIVWSWVVVEGSHVWEQRRPPDVRGRQKHQFASCSWLSVYLALHCFRVFLGYFEVASVPKDVSPPSFSSSSSSSSSLLLLLFFLLLFLLLFYPSGT
ncbi:hypothetical protein GWK47_030326 [Chionoecetes opilio]|uniref:Uncharacterized protein n=1 Tax=Chionoecetes opilio TaxID=41210 RepID=A0A8J4Z1V4_CHIOP|nr:hypothetical protein GWK47_030326 [Chionoecetes opilio]